MSLTVALREELAHSDASGRVWRLAEASAIVDLAGSVRLSRGEAGMDVSVVVRCAVGAVARRLRSTLVEHLDTRPGLAHTHAGNLHGGDAYLVEIRGPALTALGLLDAHGRPLRRDPSTVRPVAAYLAGALMAAGTLSSVGTPVHLEIRTAGEAAAEALARVVPGAASSQARVVVKSGDAVADLLATVGAHQTFLAFDQGRMRRDLRRQVNRSVNADRANLRRATAAAATQISAIEALVSARGWEAIPQELAEVALARIANPEASLADLGELLDPPLSKAAVHRRLRRIADLVDEQG